VIFQGTYDPRPQVDLVAQYEQVFYFDIFLLYLIISSEMTFATKFYVKILVLKWLSLQIAE
jgi:hypothetical protein